MRNRMQAIMRTLVEESPVAVTFFECLMACPLNPELVENYNRLRNTAVGANYRTPVERFIDRASGYEVIIQQRTVEVLAGFVHLAHDIWQRMPLEARQ